MEGYSPEPGEIIEETISQRKSSHTHHKRRRSSEMKHKRKHKSKHHSSKRSRSKNSKSKSSSSLTLKGSPKQKEKEQSLTIAQQEEEVSFLDLKETKTTSNSKERLEERRRKIEEIRLKHQIQKTPATNEEALSNEEQENSMIPLNNNSFFPSQVQQESFIKYIDEEREQLLAHQQGGNKTPPNDNHLEKNSFRNDNHSPATPDMFSDDFMKETPNKVKNNQTIDLSFHNQKESIGYYIPQLNEIIYSKYKVIGVCGKGVFSSVVKVLDIINNIEYALKIIRNIDIMKLSGDKEKSIISLLNKEDSEDKAHIIRLKESFEFNNHLCMIMDLYQMNLRDLIKASKDEGIPMNQLKSFAKQLIMGFILIHKNRLIHADCKHNRSLTLITIVKPDNTVIDETGNNIRICDFGSAFYEEEAVITSELVSRYYRAPEVILGMKPNQKIDIWSLGCTLFELYTGSILFPGRSNNEMIKMFIEVKGKFSKKLMKRCFYCDEYFSSDGNYFKSKEYDEKIKSECIKDINIHQLKQKDVMTLLKESDKGKKENDNKSLGNFANFLEGCFVFDPFKRLSAIDAYTHPFLIISN